MIITNSALELYGQHELTQYTESEEHLTTWQGDEMAQEKAYLNPVKISLSPQARQRLKDNPSALNELADSVDSTAEWEQALINNLALPTGELPPMTGNEETSTNYFTPEEQALMDIIANLFYQITGEEIELEVFDPSSLNGESEEAIKQAIEARIGNQNRDDQERVGWGFDYSYHELNYEREVMEFSAQGIVKTADGREINLEISLRMSREFVEEKHLSIKAGDALLDPLVINFDGSAPELSDQKIVFDLDVDGKQDSISYLRPGSGFLALDKNSDGRINDGSELFGPQSGNGFNDLAEYDDDGNGWIDEHDEVFTKLSVWTFDQNGNSKLIGLKESGVGAVFLGHAETEFSVNDDANQQLGQLRRSSLYLNENGSAGTIHQLDLVV